MELRRAMLKVFDENKIEAIICPVLATPALEHASSGDTADIAVYSFIWNIVNFPCGNNIHF